MVMPEFGAGSYRYSLVSDKPTLYSSTYAAMTRSLYNDLTSAEECRRWVDYLNRYQDDDGLFRDPVMFDQGWYAGDPLTCGRPHLTCHVIGALTCLGGVAEKDNSFLSPWLDADFMRNWLSECNWSERVAWTGNEIMNVGTLLQYERDFHHNQSAGKAIQVMLEWLSTHHINPDSGIWGDLDITDPLNRSHAVQAAMTGHLVFSTLHTNDAVSSIVRLRDLGLEPFLISSTLLGSLAQRLVRTICSHCEE